MRTSVAHALIEFLKVQRVARDGREHPFFAGCFGIFGHGNVAGVAQALQANPDFRYYQARNEQGMVHAAAAYAKASGRLRAFACTSSIGPGATNMLTGAAAATINRLPVLLLPGDIFARRNVGSVLQQLEAGWSRDVSVNDAFRPVSRYWDRINRPEQLPAALLEAMRVLTSPAETGAVTLALPQDVQAEAAEFPDELFRPRVWQVARQRPDAAALREAATWIRAARRPLFVAGGGVVYSEAGAALAALATSTGIPVADTKAGKGAVAFDHPQMLGGIGVAGTLAANRAARGADLVIGIGTRYTDFTTASMTAFQDPAVRFININVAEFDVVKQAALPLQGDALATLNDLAPLLAGYAVPSEHQRDVAAWRAEWAAERARQTAPSDGPLPSQAQVIGAINDFVAPDSIVISAAGSLPGDLQPLWCARLPGTFDCEYGYSTMGYEIAGGLGAKLAAPDRDVYVLVGDASYLMLAQELVTAVQEGIALTIVLLDNHGWGSIHGLSHQTGGAGWGTRFRRRDSRTSELAGEVVPIDFVANARSLGAQATRAGDLHELLAALEAARDTPGPSLISIEIDPDAAVPSYDAWWNVPVAEVSVDPNVRAARERYEHGQAQERAPF